jgi:hypothetical protein
MMSRDARQAASRGPSPVAIHNDRDMARQRLTTDEITDRTLLKALKV